MKPRSIRPPYSIHNLTYKSDLTVLSASQYAVKSWRCNDLYDPDPAILTTGYTGFKWLTQAYDEYQVQKSQSSIGIYNQGAATIAFITYTFEQLDALIGSWQQARDAGENQFSTRPVRLSPVGIAGSNKTLRSMLALQDMVKRGVYQFSELYSGAGTTTPVTPIYVNLILYSFDGTSDVKCEIDASFNATSEFTAPKFMDDNTTLQKEIHEGHQNFQYKHENSVIHLQYPYVWDVDPVSKNLSTTQESEEADDVEVVRTGVEDATLDRKVTTILATRPPVPKLVTKRLERQDPPGRDECTNLDNELLGDPAKDAKGNLQRMYLQKNNTPKLSKDAEGQNTSDSPQRIIIKINKNGEIYHQKSQVKEKYG